jgi:hypothetical protein
MAERISGERTNMGAHDEDDRENAERKVRLEVSAEHFRTEAASVMKAALGREVAVVGEDGEARLLIIRKLAPLD